MADSMLSGSTVLVTGGAGFIGGHLATRLAEDNEVRVLDSLVTGDRDRVPDAATLIEGDVRDPDTVARAAEGVDVVFHQAAEISVPATVEDPVGSDAVNVDGTLNVLESARKESARVVFASSAAVYGSPESVPVGEDDPKDPESPYGIQKLAADQYARVYDDLYDIETVPLRYFNVYGPGHTGGYAGVIDVFLRQARGGDPVTVEGDGKQTRDFVHVDDVVRANLAAATTDDTGTAYNVGTGESITILELAEMIVDLTDSNSEIVHVDPREGDVRHSRADIDRATDRLGFESSIELRDGLQTLV